MRLPMIKEPNRTLVTIKEAMLEEYAKHQAKTPQGNVIMWLSKQLWHSRNEVAKLKETIKKLEAAQED